jgi:thioredoxin-related protein
MMKTYELYVFTQESCAPCTRLKDHVQTLTEAEQAELHFVPFKTATGSRTALAEELSVDLTPTLVVVHEEVSCQLDADGDEDCDYVEQSVERFVGANSIIEHLPATLDAYTYAHPE